MWTRSYSRKPVHKCYSGSVKECNLSKTSVSSGSVWLKMVLILFPGKAGGILNVWVVESIYPILHWNLLKQSVCTVSIHKTQNIAKLIQLIYQPSRFIHILQIMKVIWIQVQTTQHQLQSEWTSSKFSKSWFFLMISTWILLIKIRQYGNKLQLYFESYSMGSYIIWLDDSVETLQRTCNKFLFCIDNKNKVDAKNKINKNFYVLACLYILFSVFPKFNKLFKF